MYLFNLDYKNVNYSSFLALRLQVFCGEHFKEMEEGFYPSFIGSVNDPKGKVGTFAALF